MRTALPVSLALIPAMLLFASAAFSQGTQTYRITAYKKGDNSIVSQSNVVEVLPPPALYVPNAFTPNGDGLNDGFGASGEGITDYEMRIFDRWGKMIFETNDIKTQWDGTYQGAMCPIGAYAYTITASAPLARIYEKSGTVTLVK